MILKIIPAKSAFNCANYILKEDAVLVATNMESVDAPGLALEFGLVTSLNPLKHKIIHLVISHPLGERVSLEQAEHEVREALKGLGYENCPFHAVEHFDGSKQHFHIATTPTNYDGKRIDRGGDHFKAKAICRHLEREAGLVAVTNYKDRTQAPPMVPTPEIQIADLNAALYSAILPAIKRSKTLGELAQDLLRHGIQMEASFGAKGAAGLGFRLLGDQGGFLTASEIHPSFTIVKLQKKHGLSYEMGRDDAHLVPMKRKPQQPVQPVLAAMTEPAPPSPRIQSSVTEITRHILESYKQRSTYGQGRFIVVAPPAAKRGSVQPIRRPATPAILTAVLSTRLRAPSPTPDRGAGGPVRGMVQPGHALPSPGLPDHAPTVGTRLPNPTQGLEGAQPEAPGNVPVQPRHDSGPNLVAARPDPGGRGTAPGHEGWRPDPGSQATASPGLPATPGGASGGEPDRRQRPSGPGAPSQRQQNAPGSAHGPGGPAPAPGARTGHPGLGGKRGPGSPHRGTPGLSEGALQQLEIARKIMAELPRIKPPRVERPMTADAATILVGESIGSFALMPKIPQLSDEEWEELLSKKPVPPAPAQPQPPPPVPKPKPVPAPPPTARKPGRGFR